MRFLEKQKDGGPESNVDAFILIEIKALFSIMLLRFNKGYRTAFHSHAFHALTWFLFGDMEEVDVKENQQPYKYKFNLIPKVTLKTKVHRVIAFTTSWCFTIRGPWDTTWFEINKEQNIKTTLTHGRKPLFIESTQPKQEAK